MDAQYLQDLAQSMGLPGESFGQLGSYDSSTIASSLAGAYGIDPSLLPEGLFTGITPGMLQGTYGKTYSPIIQAKQPSLIENLSQSITGQKGRQAHGGFGRSGGWEQYQQGAKDVYGKGMTDIVTGIGASRGQAYQNIFDLMSGWQQTAQNIRYG